MRAGSFNHRRSVPTDFDFEFKVNGYGFLILIRRGASILYFRVIWVFVVVVSLKVIHSSLAFLDI